MHARIEKEKRLFKLYKGVKGSNEKNYISYSGNNFDNQSTSCRLRGERKNHDSGGYYPGNYIADYSRYHNASR